MNPSEQSVTAAFVATVLCASACGGPSTPPPESDAEPGGRVEQTAGDEAASEEGGDERVPDALIAFAPCTDDYRSLCEDVAEDDGAAVIACLRDHRSALDRHCLAALDPEAPQTRSSRCVAAISQLCPDADDPASRTECIRRYDRLEPICRRSSGGRGGQGPAAGGRPGGQGMGGGRLGGGRPY
jgi:hypothetical protein